MQFTLRNSTALHNPPSPSWREFVGLHLGKRHKAHPASFYTTGGLSWMVQEPTK